MELYVNGEKFDIVLEDEKTVNDVLKSFEIEAEKSEATTVGINVNGENIDVDSFGKLADMPIEENTKIELNVISKGQILDSLVVLKKRFDDLSVALKEVPVYLQGGKDMDANAVIANLAESVNYFCHTVTMSALFPEIYAKIKIDGSEVEEFFKDFTPVFSDFEESLKNNDTVTSGDLCEYEIAPRIEAISNAISAVI